MSLCRWELVVALCLCLAAALCTPQGSSSSPASSRAAGADYALHLAPQRSGAAALALHELVFAIATHKPKEAHVFAGRPHRLVGLQRNPVGGRCPADREFTEELILQGCHTHVVTDHEVVPSYRGSLEAWNESWGFYPCVTLCSWHTC